MKAKPGPCSTNGGDGALPEMGEFWSQSFDNLKTTLERETELRERAECRASIQSHAVQLALDLLVREPDPESFFRELTKGLIDQTESKACGVWLLDDDGEHCELWMAHVGDQFFKKGEPGWDTLKSARVDMAAHLLAYKPGWTETVEYTIDDPRLPESVCGFNCEIGLNLLAVAPLKLPTRNLGWIALS